ncbi:MULTISPECIES: polyhydroxyalkanoic acid system family protein [Pacificimonas]|nr:MULTISPECIES: polyhydroxyalkanoic acid system family protein [Pacificimonas]MBZ6379104.1 polyhydroxyalkanoic acid system family protein [Pacificimonas aurantium]
MERTFTQSVRHGLGREEAKRKLEEGLPNLLGLLPGGESRHQWDGDTMLLDYSALGQSASARLQVDDAEVVVTITVRGVLAAMGDKLSQMFGRGTKALLEDKSR